MQNQKIRMASAWQCANPLQFDECHPCAACLFDLSALLPFDCKNIELTDLRPTGLIARYKGEFGEIKVVFLILDLVQ